MTDEEIDKLEAGREMDLLIYQILNPDDAINVRRNSFTAVSPIVWEMLPHYSTSIADAWMVVEKLRDGFRFCCLDLHSNFHYQYVFSLTEYNEAADSDEEHQPSFIGKGEAAPLAICRAALKTTNKVG